MGLPREIENVVILAYAAQADRTLSLRGAPVRGMVERLDDDAELREQPLPDDVTWAKARKRAADVFGLAPSEVRKGATVERLAADLRERAQAARGPLATIASALRNRMTAAGLDPNNASRMTTLMSAAALASGISAETQADEVIRALADADLRTSDAAVGRATAAAPGLAAFLGTFEWDPVLTALGLPDHRRAAAEQIGRALAEALEADEHAVPLEGRLREILRNAYKLLATMTRRVVEERQADTRDGEGNRESERSQNDAPESSVIAQADRSGLSADQGVTELEQLTSRLRAEPEARLDIRWRLTKSSGPR
jgi:hypothetical protein